MQSSVFSTSGLLAEVHDAPIHMTSKCLFVCELCGVFEGTCEEILDHEAGCSGASPSESASVPALNIEQVAFYDSETGTLLCTVGELGGLTDEIEVRLIAELLDVSAISREITFTCEDELKSLRLVESVTPSSFPDEAIVRTFDFGYVIPGSINTWSQSYDAPAVNDPSGTTLAKHASLHVKVDFFDGERFLSTKRLHVSFDV